jgi:hypothetical protein
VAVVSPITRDLAIDGWGLAGVGIAGLIAASVVIDGGAGRAIIPFIIVALVFGLAQVVVSGGWLRTAVDDAPAAPPDLVPEAESATIRRAGLPSLIALVLLVLALVVWVQFAALLAGLAFSAGMTDLRSRQWINALERDRDVTILREVARLPFATARKPLWARPRGD